MSTKIIDATKKLTIRHFKTFESTITTDILILIDDIEIERVNKQQFVDCFKLKAFESLDDSSILTFKSEAGILKIAAKDYKKWSQEWWANRIFADQPSEVKSTLNIQIQRAKDNEILAQQVFSSSDLKQIIQFVNSTYPKMYLQSYYDDSKVTFNISYEEINFKDISFEELQKNGFFITEKEKSK